MVGRVGDSSSSSAPESKPGAISSGFVMTTLASASPPDVRVGSSTGSGSSTIARTSSVSSSAPPSSESSSSAGATDGRPPVTDASSSTACSGAAASIIAADLRAASFSSSFDGASESSSSSTAIACSLCMLPDFSMYFWRDMPSRTSLNGASPSISPSSAIWPMPQLAAPRVKSPSVCRCAADSRPVAATIMLAGVVGVFLTAFLPPTRPKESMRPILPNASPSSSVVFLPFGPNDMNRPTSLAPVVMNERVRVAKSSFSPSGRAVSCASTREERCISKGRGCQKINGPRARAPESWRC